MKFFDFGSFRFPEVPKFRWPPRPLRFKSVKCDRRIFLHVFRQRVRAAQVVVVFARAEILSLVRVRAFQLLVRVRVLFLLLVRVRVLFAQNFPPKSGKIMDNPSPTSRGPISNPNRG